MIRMRGAWVAALVCVVWASACGSAKRDFDKGADAGASGSDRAGGGGAASAGLNGGGAAGVAGSKATSGAPGDGGSSGEAGAGEPGTVNPACLGHDPGYLFCDAQSVMKCSSDLTEVSLVEACQQKACVDGACSGICAPGAGRCTEGGAETCSDKGQWSTGLICANQACVGGACKGTCTPSTKRCNGLAPETCSDAGAWVAGTACTILCSGGACSGTCTPMAKQCNGQVPQACDDTGTWQSAAACSNKACVAGVCSGVCAPQTKQCSGNGVQVCSATGTWGTASACTGQACIGGACAGDCEPGTKQCTGNGVQVCAANGTWGAAAACSAQACVSGACVGVCAPGSKHCSGNSTETCSAAGQWGSTAACVAPQTCTGAGVCADVTAPTVLSISPTNAAKGVSATAKIVITFSEAVNQVTAQSAFTSNAGQVAFSWNAAGTVVTITPATPFLYAESTVPNAAAKSYTVTMGTGVQDLAGNYLASAASSTFSTLRRITTTLSRDLVSTYVVTSYVGQAPYLANNDGGGVIGDGFSNEYNRVFPDFDITPLPAALQSVESATLSIDMSVVNPTGGGDWGTPFTVLGNLVVDHITDVPIKQASLDVAALARIGSLMTSSAVFSGIKTIDVTDSVANDFTFRAARSNHSQYRLQFEKKTDNDSNPDLVAVQPFTTMYMNVTYIIP